MSESLCNVNMFCTVQCLPIGFGIRFRICTRVSVSAQCEHEPLRRNLHAPHDATRGSGRWRRRRRPASPRRRTSPRRSARPSAAPSLWTAPLTPAKQTGSKQELVPSLSCIGLKSVTTNLLCTLYSLLRFIYIRTKTKATSYQMAS